MYCKCIVSIVNTRKEIIKRRHLKNPRKGPIKSIYGGFYVHFQALSIIFCSYARTAI